MDMPSEVVLASVIVFMGIGIPYAFTILKSFKKNR